MMFFLIRQCRPGFQLPGLRLLMVVLSLSVLSSLVLGQTADSVIHMSATVSSEYADIFRKRSEQSSVTFSAKTVDVSITAARASDTLILGFSWWNQYASYNHIGSDISVSAENKLRFFSLQWISSLSWIDYSGTVFVPVSYSVLPLHGAAWIRLKPLGNNVLGTFSIERTPVTFTSGIGFKDYSFPLNERSGKSSWSVTLQSQPLEIAECSFSWGKSNTTTKGEADGFSSPLDWNTHYYSARLNIFLESKSSIWIGWDARSGSGKAPLIKDNLRFGSLSFGEEELRQGYIGTATVVFSLPFSSEYHYRWWEGEAHGHIESWPFLSFVESIFANRITYEAYGKIKIHQLECSTMLHWGNWNFKPTAGILYLLPDLSLLYREYDLPPIVKSVTREQLSTQQCWLLQLGCRIEFPMYSLRIALHLEQYIPISITDRSTLAGATEQSTPGLSGTNTGSSSTIDGGRRIRIEIHLP
jgi:hypothetical protein